MIFISIFLSLVPLVPQSECAEIYKDYKLHPTPRMICAGGDGSGICSGDMGAPLVLFGKNDLSFSWKRATLIGIASWTKCCSEISYPNVFSRISHARDWIRYVTGL